MELTTPALRRGKLSSTRALEIGTLGETHCLMRRFPEADQEISQTIALAPDVAAYHRMLAMCRLLAGDTAGAAQTVRDAAKLLPHGLAFGGSPTVAPGLLARVLGPSLPETILTSSLKSFNGDSLGYYIVRMEYYSAIHDNVRLRAVADSARRMLDSRIRARKGSLQAEQVPLELFLALADAFLGRTDETVRLVHESLQRVPVSRDGVAGPIVLSLSVEALIRVGELDEALGLIEQALAVPGPFSSALLRLDPLYAPLHGNPRFERLAATR